MATRITEGGGRGGAAGSMGSKTKKPKDSAKKALTKAALKKLKPLSTSGSDIVAKNSVKLQPKVGHPFYQEERRINENRAASELLLERKSGNFAKNVMAKLHADHVVSAKPKVIKIK